MSRNTRLHFSRFVASELPHLLDTASKFALFSVSGLKYEKLIKKQTYMETETCKLYSKVFCQISSKLILTILSHTVSKLVHFLRYSVIRGKDARKQNEGKRKPGRKFGKHELCDRRD